MASHLTLACLSNRYSVSSECCFFSVATLLSLCCSVSLLFSPFVVYVVCLICVSLIGGACIRGAYWTEQCGVIGHAGVGWGAGETERGNSACYMHQVISLLWTPVQSNPINLQ